MLFRSFPFIENGDSSFCKTVCYSSLGEYVILRLVPFMRSMALRTLSFVRIRYDAFKDSSLTG